MLQIDSKALGNNYSRTISASTDTENDAEKKMSLTERIKRKESKLKRLKRHYEYEQKRQKLIKKKIRSGRKDYKKIIKSIDKVDKRLLRYQNKKSLVLKALKKQTCIRNLVVRKRLERLKMMGEYKKFYRKLYEKEKNELEQKRRERKKAPKYVHPQVRYIRKLIKKASKQRTKLLDSLENARNNLGIALVTVKTSNLKNLDEVIKATKAKIRSLKSAQKKERKSKQNSQKKEKKRVGPPRSISEVRIQMKRTLRKRNKTKVKKGSLKLEDLYTVHGLKSSSESSSDIRNNVLKYHPNKMNLANIVRNDISKGSYDKTTTTLFKNTAMSSKVPEKKKQKTAKTKSALKKNTTKRTSKKSKIEKKISTKEKVDKFVDTEKNSTMIKEEMSIEIEKGNYPERKEAGKETDNIDEKLLNMTRSNQNAERVQNSEDKTIGGYVSEIIGDTHGNKSHQQDIDKTTKFTGASAALLFNGHGDIGGKEEVVKQNIDDFEAQKISNVTKRVMFEERLKAGCDQSIKVMENNSVQQKSMSEWINTRLPVQREGYEKYGRKNVLQKPGAQTTLLYMNPRIDRLSASGDVSNATEGNRVPSVLWKSPLKGGRLVTLGDTDQYAKHEKERIINQNRNSIRRATNEQVMADAVVHLLTENSANTISENSRTENYARGIVEKLYRNLNHNPEESPFQQRPAALFSADNHDRNNYSHWYTNYYNHNMHNASKSNANVINNDYGSSRQLYNNYIMGDSIINIPIDSYHDMSNNGNKSMEKNITRKGILKKKKNGNNISSKPSKTIKIERSFACLIRNTANRLQTIKESYASDAAPTLSYLMGTTKKTY